MPVATLTNLTKSFGHKSLFQELNLNIYRGQRIGLIGANGSGKTTLLRVLLGEVPPDDGLASVRKGLRVGYLEQNPSFADGNTVMDEAEVAFSGLHSLSHRLRELEHEMAPLAGEELDRALHRYQQTQHEFELAGGYAWRHRLEATLQGVGLQEATWDQEVSTLSGGQRSRLALARLLIGQPDILLMDEPTNHLDLAAVQWLEDYLLDFKGAVLLISHDRYLLDRLATRIAWLHYAKLTTFTGNYSHFIVQRDLMELSQDRAYQQQQEDIAKQQEFIRRFGAGQRSKEAKGRQKRLQRLLDSDQMIDQVRQAQSVHIAFDTDRRAGDRLLSVRDLSKQYGENRLWQQLTFDVARGERIGIIGPNGSGKTTLLETLVGRRDADGGAIRWGANIVVGYYDQNLDDLDEDNTAFEEVMAGRDCGQQAVRDMLGALLLGGEQADRPIAVLSGGERARVRLAQLLLDKPNVLVMDEPTNHLDIASCEALEGALRQFPGTIICVSHDRYFLDKIASRLLVLQPPRVVDFPGNYTAWRQRCLAAAGRAGAGPETPAAAPAPVTATKSKDGASARSQAAASSAPASEAAPAKKRTAKGNPYLRAFGRLNVAEIEQEMTKAQEGIAACQQAFGDPVLCRDAARLKQTQQDLEALSQRLAQLEEEYLLRLESE